MHSPTPFLTVFVLAGSVAALITLVWGLRSATRRAGVEARERGRVFWTGTALLAGWLIAALVTSWLELYRGTPTRIPTIEFGLFIPILIGVALYRSSPLVRRITAAASQGLLVGIQTYRVEGVIFLVLYAGGFMPSVFAVPAGSGDLAIGLLAPAVALAYMRGLRGSRGLVRAWNLLGLCDLAVAVTTGFFSSPSAFQRFAIDNPNTLITAFPVVLIPVFLVPLAVLLHLASLANLGRKNASQPAFNVPAAN